MKKIILPSILATIAGFAVSMAVGYLFNFIFPSLQSEYENSGMFRPWSDPLMMLYFLYPIYIAFILAWIWTKVKSVFAGSVMQSALSFTTAYFLIATLPGMLMTISSFKVSLIMTCTWAISGFIQTFVISLILAKMIK
jgi:hypothetical protein